MERRDHTRWSNAEVSYMLAELNDKVHPVDFIGPMNERFGFERSIDSVTNKLNRLGWHYRHIQVKGPVRVAELAPPENCAPEILSETTLLRKKPFKPIPSKFERFAQHESYLEDMFKDADLHEDEVYKLVVMPDTHVPDHDEKAVQTFCDFLWSYQPHGFINIGDMLEMEPVSRWDALHPYPRRLVPQIKEARKVFLEIDGALAGKCTFKRFFMGNHEDWLDQYLVKRIPEVLDGLEELGTSLKLKDLLGLRELGYKTIPVNEILKIGDAHFIHGYCTGLHHALGHLKMFGANIYYGHLHDVQQHSSANVRGIHEAQSLGCLRDLNARFLKGKPNNWVHAFGIFEFNRDGTYTKYVPTMIDGKFNYNGKRYG